MIGGPSSAFNAGLAGIQNGMQNFQRSAEKIAQMGVQEEGTDLADLAETSVDMLQAENQVEASTKVVKSYDDALGTLLDVRA
ncbi:MAG: flagellar biosynthesis protein FlgE [Pseudomonadota bacterium]|nr:flagellar biosynthesis protein FlgE [Pseudomonadota bacterium]